MVKKITLLGLMVALGLALAAPALAANGIQGSVANVPTADSVAMGQARFRIWSLQDATGYNLGTATPNAPALSTATAGGGNFQPTGYRGPQDNTVAYASDADNQSFYQLGDAQVNASACNHAAWYSIQGAVFPSAASTSLGDDRTAGCAGAGGTNCWLRADSTNSRSTAINNVAGGWPDGSHSLTSSGGFSAVSTVNVNASASNPCGAGQANLTWTDAVVNSLKDSAANPYQGATLYRFHASDCGTCPTGDVASGWVAAGTFAAGSGGTNHCVPMPGTGADYYALRYRFNGPGGTSVMESGINWVGANSQCVAATGTVVRVNNVNARYAGRNTVNVTWTSGVESGLDSFYVTRSNSPTGTFARVSDKVTLRGDGANYTFSDKVNRGQGRVVYYSIEIVNADGTSSSAGPAAVTLPTPNSKKDLQ